MKTINGNTALNIPPKISTLIDGLCSNLQYRAELFRESWKLLSHALAEHYGFCQVWLSRTAPEGELLPIVGSSWVAASHEGGPCAAYFHSNVAAAGSENLTSGINKFRVHEHSCNGCPASGGGKKIIHLACSLDIDQESRLSLSFHRPGRQDEIPGKIVDEIKNIVRYVRRKLHSAVQQQDQMLVRASRASQVAMFMADRDFNITWMNSALSAMRDFREEDLYGKRFDVLHNQIAPQDEESAANMLSQLAAGLGWKTCLHDRTKEGEHRVIIETVTPLLDAQGQAEAYVGVLQELSADAAPKSDRCVKDELTGLLNRHYFAERMKMMLCQSQRDQQICALLFLDLDRFKQVNDQLGHVTGDHLLTVVGERMLQSTRGIDLVARYGGDEFVLLISEISEPKTIELVAQRIIESFSRPFMVDNIELSLGISIGVALYPEHASDDEALMRCADTAMYEAKAKGGGYRLYQAPRVDYPCPV